MKNDLPRLLKGHNLCRTRAAVHMFQREHWFHRATPRLRQRFQLADALELLIRNGVLEAGRIGRRLRLIKYRLARLPIRAAAGQLFWVLGMLLAAW
jgi:hypothetical protein